MRLVQRAADSAPRVNFSGAVAAGVHMRLHFERNSLRALPCRPLASAWVEHSLALAFLASSVALSIFVVAAGVLTAGACVCAVLT
jgi:hypothetical protein